MDFCGHEDHEGHAGDFGEEGFGGELGLVFAEKVEWEVEPDEEEEAAEVVEEVPDVVALVADCGGEVFRAVSFDVVVFHVVIVV